MAAAAGGFGAQAVVDGSSKAIDKGIIVATFQGANSLIICPGVPPKRLHPRL
jgi:hypothetical protein